MNKKKTTNYSQLTFSLCSVGGSQVESWFLGFCEWNFGFVSPSFALLFQYTSPYAEYGELSKKFSSCSTIFIDDSTVSQPNLKNTIKAVALAVFFHIRNRQFRERDQLEGRLLDIFDEKMHPLSVSCTSQCFPYVSNKERVRFLGVEVGCYQLL